MGHRPFHLQLAMCFFNTPTAPLTPVHPVMAAWDPPQPSLLPALGTAQRKSPNIAATMAKQKQLLLPEAMGAMWILQYITIY